MRDAIANEEIILYYQPKLNLSTGECTRVEALVRWRHPVRGLVPPDQFIPLAEQTGLIRPLTKWVLTSAIRQCRGWQDAGMDLGVAVNLSMRNLHDPELVEQIAGLLRHWGVDPSLLKVEVTESAVMRPVLGFSEGIFSIDMEKRAESASTSIRCTLRVTLGSAQI